MSEKIRSEAEAPLQLFEGADLVAYAVVPRSARFTGRVHLIADGKRIGAVPRLAICRLHEDGSLMLVHCNRKWDVLGVQAWNTDDAEFTASVDVMKAHVENYYEGLAASWQLVNGGTEKE